MVGPGATGDDLLMGLRTVETVCQDDYAHTRFPVTDGEVSKNAPIAPVPERFARWAALEAPAQAPVDGIVNLHLGFAHFRCHTIRQVKAIRARLHKVSHESGIIGRSGVKARGSGGVTVFRVILSHFLLFGRRGIKIFAVPGQRNTAARRVTGGEISKELRAPSEAAVFHANWIEQVILDQLRKGLLLQSLDDGT